MSAVAPVGCWIARYLAKERKGFYWYYKLQATDPIFPTKTSGKLSKYKHLDKVGSKAYLDAVEQVKARGKIEALARSIETLNQGLKDLLEETSNEFEWRTFSPFPHPVKSQIFFLSKVQ